MSTSRLRELLTDGGTVVAPFVYDGLQARLAERAGFDAIYMTGFGTAASKGMPEVGLLTMSEMVSQAATLAAAVSIPLISDADTGYGNALNVTRTVREYERAGAAAIHIEDQVWPKRCGFLAGKEVIPLEQMTPKVRAAKDARRDGDFVIIARTDALQPEGWDAAERRARAYYEAGADLVFVDGIRSRDDLDAYQTRLGDIPCLYNGSLEPVDELAARGFRIIIHGGTMMKIFEAIRAAMEELKSTGQVQPSLGGRAFSEMMDVLGVEEALALGQKYDD